MKSASVPDQAASRERDTPINRLAAGTFWLYKRCLSPLLHAVAPGGCRYLPTCSEYAYTAVERFGIWRGGWLAGRRLLRCHPWAKGGLDPVPEAVSQLNAEPSR